MAQVNLADVQKYLSGMSFPADKQKILKYAKDRGASGDIVNMINSLPNREFTDAADVSRELGGGSE